MFDFNFRMTKINYYIGTFTALICCLGTVITFEFKLDTFANATITIIFTIILFFVCRQYMSVSSNVIIELMK